MADMDVMLRHQLEAKRIRAEILSACNEAQYQICSMTIAAGELIKLECAPLHCVHGRLMPQVEYDGGQQTPKIRLIYRRHSQTSGVVMDAGDISDRLYNLVKRINELVRKDNQDERL